MRRLWRWSDSVRAWMLAVTLVLAPLVSTQAQVSIAHAAPFSALSFNRSYGEASNSAALSNPNNLTIEAWVQPTLAAGWGAIAGNRSYRLFIDDAAPGFYVFFSLSIGNVYYQASTIAAGPLATNQWYHIAGTFDGSNARVYINGTLSGTLIQAGTLDAFSDPFDIGTGNAINDFFTGEISEVRVSNTIRYTSNFNPPTSAFSADANTVGLWHLDEGSGSTIADSSQFHNNGNLIGGPVWVTDSPIGRPHSSPAITSSGTSNVQATVATITWTTDQASTSQVLYGPTSAYDSQSTLDPSLVTSHSVTIGGLTPTTLYNYKVVSQNAAGDAASSSNFTLTTTNPATTSALTGEWSPVVNWPLVAVHSALLYTGDVLVWDAWETPGTPSVRLWHPSTQTFTRVPNQTSEIFCSGHATLADGRLLVIGGHNGGETGITDVNVFDPATSSWSLAASTRFPRWYPAVTELPDGRVVSLSGQITSGNYANTPEIYNPTTNIWSQMSVNTADVTEKLYPLTFLQPTGKIYTWAPSTGLSRVLDVTAQTWAPAGPGVSPVLNGSAAMYRPGKILVSGGGHPDVSGDSEGTSAVLDLTAPSPAWRQVASMASGRTFHDLTVLPDGKVLASGGSNQVNARFDGPLTAEIWDPNTELWTTMAAERNPRMYHSTATLLPDGRVLVAGGGRYLLDPTYWNAEIYSPPYLFKGPRPTVTNAPSSATYGSAMTVDTPDASNITSVALTDLGSVTHTQDWNQHFVPLTFTRTPTGLTVQAPGNANLAPPGYYMLWLVNSNGVPSVARMVKLGGTSSSTPPTVSMTAPTAGASVSGTSVNVAATATPAGGATISSVQFLLDGSPVGSPLTTSPYQIAWDSTSVPNGSHTLSARATDSNSTIGTATDITVTVANSPPVISQVSSGTPSSTTATITWITNVPATSQVQYGTTLAYANSTTLDSMRVISHAQTLTGLQPGTLYHFRVLSNDGGGNPGVSGDFIFTTAPPGAPVISNPTATNITPVGAVITWTTDQPSTSQVEYGTSLLYTNSTTLDTTLVTSHSQTLTGLQPNTTYHCRVISRNAQSQQSASNDFTFATLPQGSTTLVGDTTIEATADSNPAGSAQAFQYIASASGTATHIFVYLDASNTASRVVVGVYTNTASNDAGTLLAQATIMTPTSGAWNSVSIAPVNVTAGTRYWIAVLNPPGTGTIGFRDVPVGTGGPAQGSVDISLTTLPASWTPGSSYGNSPLSAYVAP